METQVSFLSGGEQIFGVLHVPEVTPAAGIIMCHGFTGSKSEAHRLFVVAARDFCGHGLAVLRFDFRGSGDSAGEFSDMTIHREIEDAQAAFDFLAARPEVDSGRLGVLGLSLGGCVSACLSGQETRIKALVLWAAVAHPGRVFDRLLPNFGDARLDGPERLGAGPCLSRQRPHVQPLACVQKYAGPALIADGTEDAAVVASDAADYQAAMGERSRLHYIEGV